MRKMHQIAVSKVLQPASLLKLASFICLCNLSVYHLRLLFVFVRCQLLFCQPLPDDVSSLVRVRQCAIVVCCLNDKVSLEPARLEERLRLNLLAECSVLAALSCLMSAVAVLLHSNLVCGTEAAVASNPALIDV